MRRRPGFLERHWQKLEHVAILATSAVWTSVVLLAIVIFWGYQDAQAQLRQLEESAALQAIVSESNQNHGGAPEILDPDPTGIAPSPTVVVMLTSSAGDDGTPGILPETPLESPTRQLEIEDASHPAPTVTRVALSTAEIAAKNPVSSETANKEITPAATGSAEPAPTHTPEPASPDGDEPRTGVPDRLVVASVQIDTAVIPVGWATVSQNGRKVDVWQVADYVAGWHKTSALAGQPGNTVLAGHHNIKGEVFRYLYDIQEGDEVDLYSGDVHYTYVVEQKLLVKEKGEPLEVRQRNAQWIAPTDDTRLTLITCWPYTDNTHRVIVVAKPKH